MQSAELKYFEIRGAKWRYYVSGEGKKGFLFLAGMMSAGPSIVKFLSDAFPDRRVVTPVHAVVDSIADYLQAIELLLDREGISETTIYGASFGSLIAQCFARPNVQKITHLILSGAAVPETSRIRTNKIWLQLLPFLPLSVLKMSLLVTLRVLLKNSNANQPFWQNEYRQLIKNITKADLTSRYRIAIDYDKNYSFQPGDFQNSSIPILILEGEADRVAGKKIREKLRAVYPQATVHVFPGAGHSILLTHAEAWKKVVRNFLSVPH